MKKNRFIFITLVLYTLSCSNLKDNPQDIIDFKETEWIVGDWENKTNNDKTIESWQKLNDTTLKATSVLVTKTDTILLEEIVIVQKNNSMFYIPSVVNQNEGKAIEFELIKATLNSMTFENLEHDFPQRICYTKINNDSLVAEISGISNGEEKSIQFPMKRVKNGI